MGTNNKRFSITDVAKAVGVTPRTIMRWEKAGKIKKSKRDWRGWRFYHPEEVDEIRKFYESVYDYEQFESTPVNALKELAIFILISTGLLVWSGTAYSDVTYLQSLSRVEFIFEKKLQKPDRAAEIYSSIKEKAKDGRLKKLLEKKIESLKK